MHKISRIQRKVDIPNDISALKIMYALARKSLRTKAV